MAAVARSIASAAPNEVARVPRSQLTGQPTPFSRPWPQEQRSSRPLWARTRRFSPEILGMGATAPLYFTESVQTLCRAPVELDHQVVNKCVSQMLFEVVAGRFESGPFALSTNYRLPSAADHSRLQRRCGQDLVRGADEPQVAPFQKGEPLDHSQHSNSPSA